MTPIAYRIGIAGGFVHSKCWSAFEQDELLKKNRRPAMGDLLGVGAEALVGKDCVWCGLPCDTPSPWLLRTTSDAGTHSYYKHSGEADGRRYIALGVLADAMLFPTEGEAATARRAWEGHVRLVLPDSKPDDPLPITIEMLRLTDIPECPIFAESYPFDEGHIPEQDRDIEVRWRDGKRCGVVTNFLRNEMLAGRWLLPHALRTRWRYIETPAKLPAAAAEPEDVGG